MTEASQSSDLATAYRQTQRRVTSRSAEWTAALVAIVCYLNILPNEFTHDSVAIVERNPLVQEPGRWSEIWTTDYWAHTAGEIPNRDLLYRPVALSSYRLVREFAGPEPWAQNLCNLLLHAIISAAVASLSKQLGGSASQALAAGLIFAAHPIHVEAVAAVVGRADLLGTLGLLSTLLAHRRSMDGSWIQRAGWRSIAAITAFLAVGSKESTVGVAVLVPMFDAYWRFVSNRRDASPQRNNARAPRRHEGLEPGETMNLGLLFNRLILVLVHSAYVWVPVGTYLALRYHALAGALHQQPAVSKTVNVLVDAPSWQHALGVLQLWGMYWAKSFWPAVLSVNYSINAIRLATGLSDGFVLFGAGVTAALLIASVRQWRCGHPLAALLLATVVITYAPTSNAFVLMQVFFAERIWYLPSVGVAILAGSCFRSHKIQSTPSSSNLTPAPQLVAAIGLAAVVLMTVRCWFRNAEWRNNGTLCAAAYRDLPDSIAVLHLYGQWLVLNNDFDRGISLLQRAVEMDLGYTQAHRTLGLAYFDQGNYERAVYHLQTAEMQAPGFGRVTRTLEKARANLLNSEIDALRRLEEKAAQNPADLDALLGLVQKLRELGRPEDALARLQEREALFQSNATWRYHCGVTLVMLNRLDDAIEYYRSSLAIESQVPQIAVELAMLLLERRAAGDVEEAWTRQIHAASLAPDDPNVLACEAELLAQRGELNTAIARYERAIQSLPPASLQRRVYEQRAKALGK